MLSLPVKVQGMTTFIFVDIAKTEYQNTRSSTGSLVKLYLEQSTKYNINIEKFKKLKKNIKRGKLQRNKERLQGLIIDLPTNSFV